MIKTKRIYDNVSMEDGARILVDRVWPRGISKDNAAIQDWFKDLAPSEKLRKWYDHDPEKWKKFRQRYRAELQAREKELIMRRLASIAREKPVTLVYAAKDHQHNNAVALRDFIRNMGR